MLEMPIQRNDGLRAATKSLQRKNIIAIQINEREAGC